MNRIQFEKPNLSELSQSFTVVDLHFHSRYSDGQNSVAQIVERVRQMGIGIAITDHNAIRGAVEIDSYKDVFSIPGIEITSKEGIHILVYFYDVESLAQFYRDHVRPFKGSKVMSSIALGLDQIVDRARLFETVIIFPHPYSPAYTGVCNSLFSGGRRQRMFERVDGVETINSENLNRWNLRCALLGFNLDKAITGGSDGHALYQIGKVVCYARCDRSRVAFLDAVKQGSNKVIGKEINLLKKVKSNGYKLKTNIKNYPDLVEKNFKYGYSIINARSKRLRDTIRRSIHRSVKKS